MNDRIKALFDFQKFEENPKLNKVIKESRLANCSLDSGDLSRVSAAGAKDFAEKKGNKDEQD